ncbi:hypothetical protein AB9P05_16550 [Roseivirga sp. BDSF3-8]|uniref:hypothetical protein n=1 Tax=Roseivirga sp. BDSF3-8 TaxID=3241598 RepID=UPI003531EDCA
MGFESIISGHIAVNSSPKLDEQLELLRQEINNLPSLNEDVYPFLPKDIFHISIPNSVDANPIQISYRSIMITFAMSVKQLEDDLGEWINKFETFLKKLPNAYESKIIVKLDPYTTGGFNDGYLNYFWEKNTDMKGNSKWRFDGDPIELQEYCKIRNKEVAQMSPELKSKIVSNFEWLGNQVGKNIRLDDYITTNKGNYDRHFTQHSSLGFNLDSFGVRTSGAVASLKGDQQFFEFKVDNIVGIDRSMSTLEIDSDMGNKCSRRIVITIENS